MDAYETANAALDAFLPTWHKAQEGYRALRIGDSEFMAARAEYRKLLAAFDEAANALVRA